MMKKRKSGVAVKKRGVEKPRKVAAETEPVTEESQSQNQVVERTVVEDSCEDQWGEWMRRVGVVVDEQMSWGTQWFPFWDVDFMGEAYVTALYSDVWDGYDDIWGFRNSDQIPTPTPTPSAN